MSMYAWAKPTCDWIRIQFCNYALLLWLPCLATTGYYWLHVLHSDNSEGGMCDWIEAGGTGIAQETAPDFFFWGGGKTIFQGGQKWKMLAKRAAKFAPFELKMPLNCGF